MYPANYFSLFPPFPRDNTVFVAMSFADQFKLRWETVIAPAISCVTVNNQPLQPLRVDQRTISDSILTEILAGISRSRLVFADITSLGKLDGRVMRNENVMYEVGLAHATRLPPEVVLFRSDNDYLAFDVAHVRVNTYQPDNDPVRARQVVANALLDAVRETETTRRMTVARIASSLSIGAISWLAQVAASAMEPPNDLATEMVLSELLRHELVAAQLEKLTEERIRHAPDLKYYRFCKYAITPFGAAVFHHTQAQLGVGHVLDAIRSREAELKAMTEPGATGPEKGS